LFFEISTNAFSEKFLFVFRLRFLLVGWFGEKGKGKYLTREPRAVVTIGISVFRLLLLSVSLISIEGFEAVLVMVLSRFESSESRSPSLEGDLLNSLAVSRLLFSFSSFFSRSFDCLDASTEGLFSSVGGGVDRDFSSPAGETGRRFSSVGGAGRGFSSVGGGGRGFSSAG
jgi:hypothetical protein